MILILRTGRPRVRVFFIYILSTNGSFETAVQRQEEEIDINKQIVSYQFLHSRVGEGGSLLGYRLLVQGKKSYQWSCLVMSILLVVD